MNANTPQHPFTENVFLQGSLPWLFAKTAAPIILIMAANGLFTLVDAYYLGEYVGADALTAVTLMFPIYMLLVALSTLVSSGYSSVYARLLGSNQISKSYQATRAAILLSALISALLIILFWFIGHPLTLWVSNGSLPLAAMGHIYMSILIVCSPIVFVLSIGIDKLRCEGQLQAMTLVTVLSTALNFLFNYLLIVKLGWGVAGSAYGTVAAQLCALIAVFIIRTHNKNIAPSARVDLTSAHHYWRDFLALGAPSSLGYLGISLSAAATLYSLQLWSTDAYTATAGAYGIITRLLTFNYLPLLGLSMAFQTIVGNNYGAEQTHRVHASLKIALWLAALYCILTQSGFFFFRETIGFIFVDDPHIVAEIRRILPLMTLLLFIFGPLLMISTYFQAIGNARLAAILGLARPYIFAIPLIMLLPFALGERGIWYAGATAELLMIALTAAVLWRRSVVTGLHFGLFSPDIVEDLNQECKYNTDNCNG